MTSLSEPYWILAYPEGEFVGLTEMKCTSPAVVFFPNTVPCGPRKTSMRSTSNNVPLIAVSSPMKTRSEEHTSELQSLMRISYAVFCLKKKNKKKHMNRKTR